jgi:hypothetical protein
MCRKWSGLRSSNRWWQNSWTHDNRRKQSAVVLEINPSRLARGNQNRCAVRRCAGHLDLLSTLVVNPFSATHRKHCLYPKSNAVGQAV